MAVWSENKVESSAINGGNEYEKKDRLSREQLNAITNNSFYASNTADEAKRIAENVEAGTNYPVSYNAQVLLEEQKAQARKNIGVIESQNLQNPNLLINSDFRINQRGATTYTGANAYTVDRWLNRETSLSVTPQANGGVKLERTSSTITDVPMISQSIEKFENLLGKTLTLTIKVSEDNTQNGFWFGVWGGNEARYATKEYGGTFGYISGTGVHSVTFTLPETIEYERLNAAIRLHASMSSPGENIVVDWIKLEIGDVATQFSPRPYAEELALCQRYYWSNLPGGNTTYAVLGFAFVASSTRVDAYLNLPCEMRTTPSVLINGSSSVSINTYYAYINGQSNAITAMSFGKKYNNTVTIQCTTANVTTNDIGIVRTTTTIATFALDAEIY